MKEFMLVFRRPASDFSTISPAEMQELARKWNEWLGGISGQGKLVGAPQRLAPEGKVLKAGGVVTDGPFVEVRELLGGFIVVKSDSVEEALTLAHGCPALERNGSVEVRPVFQQ